MARIGGTIELPGRCPKCLYVSEAATHLLGGNDTNPVPKEGDVSVCMNCTALLRFDASLDLRELREDEWQALSTEDRDNAMKVRRALAKMHMERAVRSATRRSQ